MDTMDDPTTGRPRRAPRTSRAAHHGGGAAGHGRATALERDAPRRRTNEGRWAATFFGLLLLGLGLWFFAEKTLGFDMPDISWNQFWPVILIAIGVVILYNAVRRERR